MENIIEISHLSKSFGELKAVDDLSFSVKKGELFAFLGENGAGKSTTISIICGTRSKDCGEIVVAGKNIDKDSKSIKSELGVVFQNSVLDRVLTVRDNLKSRASLYGINGENFKNRLDELVKLLDFGDYLDRAVSKLSGGQKRRIDIARAIIHKPSILILDEPTTGLDPQTRKNVWSVLNELRKNENMTIFLTTHYMEEAAEADYVVILDKGKISAEGTPYELKSKWTGDFITLYGITEEQVKGLNLAYEKVVGGYRVAVENTQKATELILKYPQLFCDYEIVKGKMDDVFLNVTGKKLDGGEGR